MNSTKLVLFLSTLILFGAEAFNPASRPANNHHLSTSYSRRISRRMAVVDPAELANLALNFVHHHQDQAASAGVQHAADISSSSSWEAILSTLYATTVDGILKPAHGHSQPLFGPPDQYLSAGKSIAPSMKALADMNAASSAATDAAAETASKLPEVAQAAISKGFKVIDASKFESGGASVLPGFAKTDGILPQHSPSMPPETQESFFAMIKWEVKYLNVIDKIPLAALVYGMVDFFLLRPGVDLYKEDIEDEPVDTLAETVAITGVRLAVFTAIALVTLIFFG
jgi:hypothetical protein